MIYYISNQSQLFKDSRFTMISVNKALEMLNSVNVIQCDTETSGLDPHLKDLMTCQLGNDKLDAQFVIDCTTVPLIQFKNLLENKLLVLHNAKFDLQFFYKQGIIPRKIYDTMIAEQVLYLGYPPGSISMALKALCDRYLHIDLDKTVRGQIRWRGIDPEVIVYGAGDVMHLQKIMNMQVTAAKKLGCLKAIQVECEAVPWVAYLEYCGIHLDPKKWSFKMQSDAAKVEKALQELNDFVINLGNSKFTYLDPQGNLFTGFADKPECIINWNAPMQVVELAKFLGFDTSCVSKSTGLESDSVGKYLKAQKGINDEFLNKYFAYKEAAKAVSSFGQGHLDAINPITGRIHTSWKQIGTVSGRMSCGATSDPNEELAIYKGLPRKACIKPNLQQLPHDQEVRACFTATKGNLWLSADYSALEARLGADIYQEKSMIDEFNHGSGDMHSLCAKMVFNEELKDIAVKDVKKLRPDLRTRVKPIEFSQQFG